MIYLITGITGFLGTALTRALLADPSTERVIGLSRDEHKQARMEAACQDARLECWCGDVRDAERVTEAMGALPDAVIHAAAMKRVERCERDPREAFKTNVLGTSNVVRAAMAVGVPKVLVISSDKATSPETCYGKTKAAAEELALGQNAYRGKGPTRISAVRYGNILGSTGSFLDTLLRARQTREAIPITDLESTRFWWAVEDAVGFIRDVIARMQGAEIWVPKLVSAKVIDLAKAIAPESDVTITGMRGPEKVHEAMIAPTEARYAWELPDCYVLLPKLGQWWSAKPPEGAVKVPEEFVYASNIAPTSVRVEALSA